MKSVDIHSAKARLTADLESPSETELDATTKTLVAPRRFGIMPYQEIPDDFDEMGREEIEKMFYGDE